MEILDYNPEPYKDLILRLSAKLNEVIQIEIDSDDGAMYPGEIKDYRFIVKSSTLRKPEKT